MLRISIISIVVSAFLLPTSDLNAQSAKKLVRDAQEFYESKNYTQALDNLNQAITLEADNAPAFYLRGKTQKQLKKFTEAIQDFTAASAGMPKNQELLQDLAVTYIETGNYKQAVTWFDRILQLNPKSAETYHKKAQTQLILRDFNGALQTTTAALAVNKSDDLSLYYNAVAVDSMKNIQLAEITYQKAIAAAKENKAKKDNPRLFKPYYVGLANAQRDLFKTDEAIASYSEAIKLDPLDFIAFTNRGALYAGKLSFPDALADFTQSIALNDKNPAAFYERAQVNKKMGQFPSAVNDFNQTILLDELHGKAFTGRGSCYESMGQYADAVRDYKRALKLIPGDKELSTSFVRAREKQYDSGREANLPSLRVTMPAGIKDQFVVREDDATIAIDAQVTDASPIKSIVVDGKSITVAEDELNPAFSVTIPILSKNGFSIQVTDIYLNTNTFNYKILKSEIVPPQITISKPFETLDRELFIENKPSIYIEGKIKDASKIKSVVINGTSASFPMDLENPPFQALVNIGTSDSLVVKATDAFGNTSSVRYKLIREDTSGANPMGTTWVVFVENSNYKNLQHLEGPARDVSDMRAALADYKIDKIIHKKDLSKAELDKFFSIELRDQIQKNRVKSLIIWYAGHGKFINETGYWIPVDGDSYDEFTYYSVNNLRASIQAYTMLKHVVVVSDACESGPAFYMAMRDDALVPKICDDWEVTKFRSAQVITSSNKELSNDNSLFTQAFANTLNNNPGNCISIESIAVKVSAIVKQNQRQTPKFGKIKGLDDENGTFFFMKRKF